MKRILFTFALLFALPGYADIVYQEDGGIVAVGVNAPLYVRTNALAASASAVAVAQTGNTDLLQFSVGQAERVWIEVVCGGQALDAFIVLGRAHASGSWLTFAGSAAHYTAPAGVIVGASGDLTALAAGATGWVAIDVRGLDAMKLQASSGNSAGSTVTVYAGGR